MVNKRSLQNLKPRPRVAQKVWDEEKGLHGVRITSTAWVGLQSGAARVGAFYASTSVSELLERLGRGLNSADIKTEGEEITLTIKLARPPA
ncbi:MAG TPA: hypothetical protein V6D27_00875 [Vampirovibrionales bacterium]